MKYAENHVPRIVFVNYFVTTNQSQAQAYDTYDDGTLINENIAYATFDEARVHSLFTPLRTYRHSILYVYGGHTFILPIKKINILKNLGETAQSDFLVLDIYSGDIKTPLELDLSPDEIRSITEKTIYRLFNEGMQR
jgi:hypothetical protein